MDVRQHFPLYKSCYLVTSMPLFSFLCSHLLTDWPLGTRRYHINWMNITTPSCPHTNKWTSGAQGYFCIFEGLWEFLKPSSWPCHPFAFFFFKLSHMPGYAGKWHWAVPQNVGLSVSTCSWGLPLGSCPRPRATALVDTSTLNDNCPCFMYECSGHWWEFRVGIWCRRHPGRAIALVWLFWGLPDIAPGRAVGVATEVHGNCIRGLGRRQKQGQERETEWRSAGRKEDRIEGGIRRREVSWYSWPEPQLNSGPVSKKQLRIWIRAERAKKEKVLESPVSYHSVVIHTNVLTSNLFSDTVEVLDHFGTAGWIECLQIAFMNSENSSQATTYQPAHEQWLAL